MPFKSNPRQSIILGLLAAALLAPSASALSCMRPDIGSAMEKAKSAEDFYQVLVGTFEHTPLPKPQKYLDPNAPMNGIGAHMVEAWFNGRILSNNAAGDRSVTRMPIDVNVTCSGPWCGSAPANGKEVIAFVKARPGAPMMLSAGACSNTVFRVNPAKQQVKKLRTCFDKSCKSDSIRDRY